MKNIVKEFKDFISRGNVIDMAVGIIIGAAFTSIVNALVEQIIMPVITLITGNLDFSAFVIPLTPDISIGIGAFISAVISFIIIALVVFLIVKCFTSLKKKEETPAVTTKTCPYCKMEVAKDATRCPHCTSELDAKSAG